MSDNPPPRTPSTDKSDAARSDWIWAPLFLVPLACCVLPLVITAGTALSVLALGGTLAAAALLAAGVAIMFVQRRRCDPTTHPSTRQPHQGLHS
jgi:hypothetical protein